MSISSILFVCSGNICRSPTAEGLMRARAPGLEIGSAGTHGMHEGEPPDDRAISKALSQGIDIRHQRAAKIRPEDFKSYDLILGMDSGHVRQLKSAAPDYGDKIHLFLEHAGCDGPERNVPDPYYGGEDHFSRAYSLIEKGIDGLVARYGL